ncbi:MAG: DUF2065 domain-containing protein [Cellvibrionales bacterium]|nr:DUF2065 domain-containing protein [Cellvibrionales bacterium]
MDSLWLELGRAFCLLLVIEGIIPFLYPTRWRKLLELAVHTDPRTLRAIGLLSMLLGVAGISLLGPAIP